MEKLELQSGNIVECAQKAADVLRAGGVVLYPTDTLYGLGTDALSDDAVAKLYAIKGREENKPIHAIVADMDMAAHYAEVDDAALKLAKKFLPGPLTLVLKKKADINSGIARGRDTFAIRIPDSPFCVALAKEFGKPYTTTSANLAGMTSERNIEGIMAQIGSAGVVIDLILDVGELPERKPSTVIDLSGSEPGVVREGVIPAADIAAVLAS